MCQVITKCRGAGKRSRERQLVPRRVYEGFRAACLTENSSNRLGHCLNLKRDKRNPSWPRAWTQRAKWEARERRGSEVDWRREGARPAVEGKEPPSGGKGPAGGGQGVLVPGEWNPTRDAALPAAPNLAGCVVSIKRTGRRVRTG